MKEVTIIVHEYWNGSNTFVISKQDWKEWSYSNDNRLSESAERGLIQPILEKLEIEYEEDREDEYLIVFHEEIVEV